MPILDFFKIYLPEFRRNFWRYVSLFAGIGLVIFFIIFPIFGALAELLMQATGIPFLSYNNLLDLAIHHTLGLLGLLVLLILILMLIFFQFALLFIGTAAIQKGKVSFHKILKEAVKTLKIIRPATLAFFFFYFILILPFSKFIFSTPLLSKIIIPVFTMEFFLSSWQHFLILAVFYLLVFALGNRLVFILPLAILKQMKIKAAFHESLKLTKGKLFYYFSRYAAIGLLVFTSSELLYYLFYGLQLLLDKLPQTGALTAAIINLTFMELITFLAGWLLPMLIYSFLIRELGIQSRPRISEKKKSSRKFKLSVTILAILALAGTVLTNSAYLTGLDIKRPLTISHRGVNGDNGVQNTIPVLEKTVKAKPDYVEMDIQETKDHQFVVMHDGNLKALAGVNKAPQDMTLSELTKLTVREHGYSAKIPSFNDYYAKAQKLHQKLLIEIKVSAKDSPDLLNIFVQKYGAEILKNGDMVHSLDYQTVINLKQKAPKIPVSFILPYTILFPQTPADAYTLEETTLTNTLIDKAHSKGKQVFAWTVNEPQDMKMMMINGADGIITDNLSVLKEQIKQYQSSPSYANRLYMFFTLIQNFGQSVGN